MGTNDLGSGVSALIDLDRYPIHEPDRLQDVIDDAREQLALDVYFPSQVWG